MADTEADLALAREIKKLLDDDPGLTIDEIAAQYDDDVPPGRVRDVLDEYGPLGPRGGIQYVGPGGGGGWVNPEAPAG